MEEQLELLEKTAIDKINEKVERYGDRAENVRRGVYSRLDEHRLETKTSIAEIVDEVKAMRFIVDQLRLEMMQFRRGAALDNQDMPAKKSKCLTFCI